MRLLAFAVSALILSTSSTATDDKQDLCAIVPPGSQVTTAQFKALMQAVADGWTEPNPRKAADCFAADATYSSPPDPHPHQGRENLYNFFHGEGPQARKMSMVWHHLAFDEASQIGFGEYTFRGVRQFHGVTVVRLADGKIKNWREYEVQSNLDWQHFVGKNAF